MKQLVLCVIFVTSTGVLCLPRDDTAITTNVTGTFKDAVRQRYPAGQQRPQQQRWATASQRLGATANLSEFAQLVRNNDLARLTLLYREVTIFAPTNDAYEAYVFKLTRDLVFYHLLPQALSLGDLRNLGTHTRANVQLGDYPPVWISNTPSGHIFINNALVLGDQSNYMARNRADHYGQNQVLHVIDEVLNPMSEHNVSHNNAYDMLSNAYNYEMGALSIDLWLRRLSQLRKVDAYNGTINGTFFIPVDQYLSDERMLAVDEHIVDAHIIPDKVLFTRPSSGNTFASAANGSYLHILVTMTAVQQSSHTFSASHGTVRSQTIRGDSTHPSGEFKTDILLANVPVTNGVVHLIREPLALFRRPLRMFPYQSIGQKMATDIELNITYTLAQRFGLLSVLDNPDAQYTMFAPTDRAWRQSAAEYAFEPTRLLNASARYTAQRIVWRHLVRGVNTMGTLVEGSKAAKNSGGVLRLGDDLELTAHRLKSGYYVYWATSGRMVAVTRSDYECSNGVLHKTALPFVAGDEAVQLTGGVPVIGSGGAGASVDEDGLRVMWNVIKRILMI